MSSPYLQSPYARNLTLSALETPELLLTVTLRLFAANWSHRDRPQPDWRHGLISAGIGERGIPAFGGLFGIVAATPRRTLDIRCPCALNLGTDEGWLLHLAGLLQRQLIIQASEILLDWLPAAAVRLAMPAAQALATTMAEGGIIIPRRRAGKFTAHAMQPAADRGLRLMH